MDEDTVGRIEDSGKSIKDYDTCKMFCDNRCMFMQSRIAGTTLPKGSDKMVYGFDISVPSQAPPAQAAPSQQLQFQKPLVLTRGSPNTHGVASHAPQNPRRGNGIWTLLARKAAAARFVRDHMACYNCLGLGHFSKLCASPYGAGEQKSMPKCTNCGGFGYDTPACTSRGGGKYSPPPDFGKGRGKGKDKGKGTGSQWVKDVWEKGKWTVSAFDEARWPGPPGGAPRWQWTQGAPTGDQWPPGLSAPVPVEPWMQAAAAPPPWPGQPTAPGGWPGTAPSGWSGAVRSLSGGFSCIGPVR